MMSHFVRKSKTSRKSTAVLDKTPWDIFGCHKCMVPKKNPVGVQITAESPDGPLTACLNITEKDFIEGEFVHQLGARKRIQDLEEGPEKETASANDLKEAIVRLGTKYSLASRHTSFVGIDPEDSERRYHGVMAKRQVPNQVPQGFGGISTCRKSGGRGLGVGGAPQHKRKSREIQRKRSKGLKRYMGPPPAQGMPQMTSCFAGGAMASNFIPPQTDSMIHDPSSMEMGSNYCKERPTHCSWMDLVGLQGANGAFKWGVALERMLKKGTKEEVVARGAALGFGDESAWITALALKILQKRFAAEKDMWELVASKAMKFLGGKAHVVLSATESFI